MVRYPILNDCVQGSTCLPVRAVVAHMPKARLPPVVQSPSAIFNDPILGPIGIGSLDAHASGCTSLTVRSRSHIALESAHVIFFNCQHTSVHTGQGNASLSLVLMGPDSNGTQSLRSSKAGITNGSNQVIPTIPD